MAAKSTEFETNLLNHILNNLALANIGDVTGLPAGTAGSLYIGLHSADPGVAGDQTTSELSYTGYGRVPVARDNTWWTVTAGSAVNAKAITFNQCTAGSGTAAWFSVGTASTLAGHLLYRGQVSSPSGGLLISANITPSIAIGAATISES